MSSLLCVAAFHHGSSFVAEDFGDVVEEIERGSLGLNLQILSLSDSCCWRELPVSGRA